MVIENYNIDDRCYFSGNGFGKNHEIGECSLAYSIIPKVENVVEIGGGAGKVSHVINTLLTDKTQHIVVEPGVGGRGNHGDEHLKNNKKRFDDQYTIIKKFADDLVMSDLDVLKNKPQCLYVDCEGCLNSFMSKPVGKYLLKNVEFIVNEMDGHNDKIRNTCKQNGFELYMIGYGCGKRCKTEVWKKKKIETFDETFDEPLDIFKKYKMSLLLFFLIIAIIIGIICVIKYNYKK
tara:strand:+ start:1634 stop:2335 length:702 start_codon:yes stop_codon:yes gene_type:complete